MHWADLAFYFWLHWELSMEVKAGMASRRLVFGRYDYAAFLCFIAYAAGSVAIPVVLVVLAQELGFSLDSGGMTAGGALHLGRTLPMVAAMLLCGFVAGRWGKRRTFGLSVMLMGTGMGLCALSPTYGVLFLALCVAGLGEGVIEGLATPFVQDLHPAEPGRYINFTHSFWSVGVLVTVLLAGWLLAVGVSWRLIVGAIALIAFVPASMLLLPPSRHGQHYPDHPERLPWRTVLGHSTRIMRQGRFWLFYAAMFVAGGGEFCLTFWSASHIQLHYGGSAWAGGVGVACFALGMTIGRTGWGYLVSQHQLKSLVIYSALVGTAIAWCIPHATSLAWFCALLLLAGIATAPFWPSIQSYAVDCLRGTDSTMLLILLSCAGVPGCGVFTWLMGYIGNHSEGLAVAFYLVPACYLIIAILIAGDAWAQRRQPSVDAADIAS